jgi:DNA-binding CsgD family transcriptional regulator
MSTRDRRPTAMTSVPPRRQRLAIARPPSSPESFNLPERWADVISLPSRRNKTAELSERELQVLELIAGGLTNVEIGKQLFISVETVKTHLRKVLAKLQARSRAHAVALAFRHRLIS